MGVVGYASLDFGAEIHEFRGLDATSIVSRGFRDRAPAVGGVAHIARGAVRAGGDTDVISWIGPDADGRRWMDDLVATGVGIGGVVVSGTRTPSSTMIEVAAGGTICLFDPGDCHPDELAAVQSAALGEMDWIVVTVAPRALTEALLDALPDRTLLAWAVKHDDNVYSRDLIERMLARADLVSFSSGERDYVFPDGSVQDPRPGALIVETRGSDGVAWHIAGDADRRATVAAEPVRGVDTTGAGDTFVGTLGGLLSASGRPADLTDDEIDAAMREATSAVARLLRSRDGS